MKNTQYNFDLVYQANLLIEDELEMCNKFVQGCEQEKYESGNKNYHCSLEIYF